MAAIVGWDKKFQLVKVSPLANWTKKDVWNMIVDHDIPYNPLHDQGYPSIGCWPCTRAVMLGEDERAGRWSGHAKTECGLHSAVDGRVTTRRCEVPGPVERSRSPEAGDVNVSAKTEYACLAVLELATRFGSGEPVRVGHIADSHGIPARFLVQILAQLKGAGIVGSTRGVAGGYHLIRDPVDLSLADVMAVVEGGWRDVTGTAGSQDGRGRACSFRSGTRLPGPSDRCWRRSHSPSWSSGCTRMRRTCISSDPTITEPRSAQVRLRQQVPLLEQGHDPVDALVDGHLVAADGQVGLRGDVVGCRDTGEVEDLAAVGLEIGSVLVTAATDLDRGGDMDGQEAIAADHLGGTPAVFFARGDQGRDADQARLVDQLGHFGAAPQVLRAFFGGESQIPADSLPQVEAIQDRTGLAERRTGVAPERRRGRSFPRRSVRSGGWWPAVVESVPPVHSAGYRSLRCVTIVPAGSSSQWSKRSSPVVRSRIIPAPTVRLVIRSMTMNEPVARLRR